MNDTNTAPDQSALTGTEARASHYLIDIAGDTYALPQSDSVALSWVQRPQEPTYLPTLPSWSLGLVTMRNTPVLLVDLRAVLGLPARSEPGVDDQARHVFLDRAGETIGFLVERTRRFRVLPIYPMRADGELIATTIRTDEGMVRVLNIEAIWQTILHELGATLQPQAVA